MRDMQYAWEEDAKTLRKYGHVDHARGLERCARDFETWLCEHGEEYMRNLRALTRTQMADECAERRREIEFLDKKYVRTFRSAVALLGPLTTSDRQVLTSTWVDATNVIYGLVDSGEDERVRYVGMARHPAQRFWQHINGKVPDKRRAWIGSVMAARRDVLMVLIAKYESREEMVVAEGAWIAAFKERGMADLNSVLPNRQGGRSEAAA